MIDQIPQESLLVNEQLKAQLSEILGKLTSPLTIATVVDMEQEGCLEMASFLKAVASLSPLLSIDWREKGEDPQMERQLNAYMLPVAGLFQDGRYLGVAFHGTPGGQEINSFVRALYNSAGPGQPLDDKTEKKIKSLKKKNNIKVCISLSCHHCPGVVTACQRIAILNPNVEAEMVDARLYDDLVEKYKISRVPAILINDSALYLGAKDLDEIIKLLK